MKERIGTQEVTFSVSAYGVTETQFEVLVKVPVFRLPPDKSGPFVRKVTPIDKPGGWIYCDVSDDFQEKVENALEVFAHTLRDSFEEEGE